MDCWGGSVVDIVRMLSDDNNWLAYSTVFALEGGLLLIALMLAGRMGGQTKRRSQPQLPAELQSVQKMEV